MRNSKMMLKEIITDMTQAAVKVIKSIRLVNDLVTKLPLAMRFYLIGLIYRSSRMSCVCLASLVAVTHDRLYRVLYLAFPYSRRMWEWFAMNLVKDGYLIIDDCVWQKTRWSFVCVGFDDWEKSVGNECCFIDLDRWKMAYSTWFTDLAERREIKVEIECRANSVQAQKAHLHLGLYAFCLTQNKAIEKKQTIYAYKQNLFREQIPT